VQWNSLPASLATWEEAKDLHQWFPKCPAWDQAGFRGGRNVRIKAKKTAKSEGNPTTGVEAVPSG